LFSLSAIKFMGACWNKKFVPILSFTNPT
jgi:hypothetical protein